ncbi:HAD family hydrolase [Candidatus Woesebacteria bacterium]|nr:HAD family hydrolase [Candidatus Woesebacteria bacterium]
MINAKNVKAVGFDVDGTLYHAPEAMSVEVGKILIQKAAEALSQDPDELAEEYLKRRDEYRSNTQTLNSFGLDGERIFQDVWDTIAIEKYVIPDRKLVKMIETLKKKYKLFIITNGSGSQVERKITYLGLDYHDFDPRIYCYDQGWVKPEPAPFLAAIESLNLKPEEIVYVGDRVDIDIEGASAVGMKAIYVGGKSDKANVSCETVYDIVSIL